MKELKVVSRENCLKDWRAAGAAGDLLSATKRLLCESEMRFVKWRSGTQTQKVTEQCIWADWKQTPAYNESFE